MNLLTKKANYRFPINILFAIFSFLLFSQVSYHFWPGQAFVFGVAVDYLAPAFYLTDLLAIALILQSALTKNLRTVFWKGNFGPLLLLGISFAFLNSAFAISPFVALARFLKIFEAALLARAVFIQSPKIQEDYVLKPIAFSTFLVAPIGLVQLLLGESTKVFGLLGERNFTLDTPEIASRAIFGSEVLRAYSTFSHPNSFAGFLLVALFITIYLYKKRKLERRIAVALFIVCTLGIVASMSQSAVVYLLLLVAFVLFAKVAWGWFLLIAMTLFSLLAPFLSLVHKNFPQNLSLRFEQFGSALSLLDNFVLGVGLNNTILLQKAVAFKPFTLQPIHNGLLLALVEGGLVGLAGFLLILLHSAKRVLHDKYRAAIFFALVLPLALDHYLLTLQQNFLLSAVVLGFLWSKNTKSSIFKNSLQKVH